MKIYITRHGQTNWNVLKKVMGRCDEPLNDKGKEQANTTKNKLDDKKIDLIICSPLLRAKETAEIINKSKKLPIIYEKNLIQRDFGELEGLQTKEFDFDGFWNYYKNQNLQINGIKIVIVNAKDDYPLTVNPVKSIEFYVDSSGVYTKNMKYKDGSIIEGKSERL